MSIGKSKTVMAFLAEKKSGCTLSEIAAVLEVTNHSAHDVVAGMVKIGSILRTGERGNYVYKINTAYKTPEHIYKDRVAALHDALKEHKRLTRPEICFLLQISEGAIRGFLKTALKKGDLYRPGKQGYFLNEIDFHEYDENLVSERLKRKSLQEKMWRDNRREKRNSSKNNLPSVNTIFDECRKYWSGYQIHKIFGSGARA
jgi:hypothetical protein